MLLAWPARTTDPDIADPADMPGGWCVALLLLLNSGWMVLWYWYLQLHRRGFLFGCNDPSDRSGGGFIYPALPPCPPDRPYAGIVAWAAPVLGLLISSIIPPVVIRLPMNDFSETGFRNLVIWIALAILAPVVAFAFIGLIVVL
jgi:hypothetical protein